MRDELAKRGLVAYGISKFQASPWRKPPPNNSTPDLPPSPESKAIAHCLLDTKTPTHTATTMAPTRKRTSLRAKVAAKNTSAPHAAKSPRDAVSHPNSTFVPPAHILASLKPKNDGYVEYDPEAAWRTSKKDKRAMKHSVLMNKVRDAGVKKSKPRRPNNKLKTNMEGLADALPELEDMLDEEGGDEDDEWEGVESGEEDGMAVDGAMGEGLRKRRRRAKKPAGEGKMEMKSLKHKPGAMKRKRALEGREMERFGKNLAQLVGSVQRGGEVKAAAGGEKKADGAAPAPSTQADRWAALRGFIGGSMEQNPAFVKG